MREQDCSIDKCADCNGPVYPEEAYTVVDGLTYCELCSDEDSARTADDFPEEVELPEYSGPCYGLGCANHDRDEDDSWCADADQGDR